MQINLKKLTRPVDLAEYAKEYQGQAVWVWVNPTREFFKRRADLDAELARRLENNQVAEAAADNERWARETYEPGLLEWFAALFSQHADPATHWSVDELAQLGEADPALALWLRARAMQVIMEHRKTEKKS